MSLRLALALFLSLLAARLCHLDVLWVEESYPGAAAIQIAHGKQLYRDVWFDKPPLSALLYVLWGARAGWPLRLAGALFATLGCWLAYRFALELWGRSEALRAAWLLAAFLTFGVPAAVMALAPDLLMLAPHLAAVWLAWRGRAFWSGIVAGLAFLVNAKAVFVLAACALWQPQALVALALGFAVPNAVALAWLAASGALSAYIEQVWQAGVQYSAHTFVGSPLAEGVRRSANWLGFHATLAVGTAVYFWRDRSPERRRIAVWLALSLVAVSAGFRFFPRYYFQILPVMVLTAARGLTLLGRREWLVLALLLIPIVRFGPRYAMLAADLAAGRPHQWSDLAMSVDSSEAARVISARSKPGDTLFVWGYRPDIFVETRLTAGTRFLDSQPLNGVFADRHLAQSEAIEPETARARRAELVRSEPTWIVDGLGPYNPALSLQKYEDLRPWLARYSEVARTGGAIVYRRADP